MKRTLLLLLLSLVVFCLPAQKQSKKLRDLKNEKTRLEQGIQKSRSELSLTRQKTVKKEQTADFLEGQLHDRLSYIRHLEVEIDSLDHTVARLERQLVVLDSQLTEKKNKYIQSLRFARQSQAMQNPVLFVASSETFAQVFRRMRYAREYAALQKTLGIQLIAKQNEARDKRNELLGVKQQRSYVMNEVIRQRKELAAEHSVVKKNVAQLRQKQKEIEQQVSEQQKQLSALNKKIDELIAYEMEQARKRAEAEARRKREAELAKAKNKRGTADKGSSARSGQGSTTTPTAPSRWLTSEDRQLNGSLEQNKGRLPVPITGPYLIARRFGMNQVAVGITLDNKGINYMGQEGARARSIFEGEVSAVFQLGEMKNVLVRHGSYISVYCNLSSTIVRRGQKLHARDIIGTVARDDQGHYVLHFQLRRETAKLNPEQWIGR